MGRQRSCTNLWRRYPRNPAETGGASGYISGRFAIGSSGLLRLKRRLSRAATCRAAWQSRSTRSVSQGTEVTTVTEYIPCRYSTRTAFPVDTPLVLRLVKTHMGTEFNHAVLG